MKKVGQYRVLPTFLLVLCVRCEAVSDAVRQALCL
jgi:hypothetical protein